MKSCFLFFACLLILCYVRAQEKFVIYGDAGGASPVMSINIDKRFAAVNGGFGFRAGIGLAPALTRVLGQYPHWEGYEKWKITIPVGVNYLKGDPNRPGFLEIALQGTYIPKGTVVDSWSSLDIENTRIVNRFMLSGFIGYRRSPVVKGVVFRIGYNPLLVDYEVVHWFGASLGWKFKK